VTAEEILTALLRLNLVAAAAIVVVLALRPLARRRLGARAAYRLWLIVAVAAAASFIPARERAAVLQPFTLVAPVEEPAAPASGPAAAHAARPPVGAARVSALPPLPIAEALLVVWLLGAAALLARSIVSTRRLARDPSAGPALIGVLRPKLVLPADFETRFEADERRLILAHEDVHRISRHPLLNGVVEIARCASWFNPLAHVAARAVRVDQELACDAAVIAARPAERRAYAQALLKTQIAPVFIPFGGAWPSRSSALLKERVTMLTLPAPGRWAGLAGATTIVILGGFTGFAAWAQQPPRVAPPEAVWTPSADAPEGVLTELAAERHDTFIELARNASPCSASPRSGCRTGEGIDIVFFGTTNTEMFWWPDRGLDVWSQTLGLHKAVNFGSQGTSPESLLWRMQNGELDGYQAKVIVLSALCCIEASVEPDQADDLVASYEPILAEIRARQPQAKVLIFADFPRGMLSLAQWRDAAAANALAHAPLIDDETVFWVDIGERFFHPDGTYDQSMWSLDFHSRGAQAPLFQAWAEELEPWLERFGA
jgi:beta-lactamase regulating signal transducer with metallopeptidase domain